MVSQRRSCWIKPLKITWKLNKIKKKTGHWVYSATQPVVNMDIHIKRGLNSRSSNRWVKKLASQGRDQGVLRGSLETSKRTEFNWIWSCSYMWFERVTCPLVNPHLGTLSMSVTDTLPRLHAKSPYRSRGMVFTWIFTETGHPAGEWVNPGGFLEVTYCSPLSLSFALGFNQVSKKLDSLTLECVQWEERLCN